MRCQLNVVNGDVFSSSGLTALLNGKEDTISLTASRAVVSGSGGQLRTSTTTVDELAYLSGTTSSVQTQLDAKQTALTRANIGTVTWSAGQQETTLTGITDKRGYFEVLCTFDQTAITASNRTLLVILKIASLAESDMVIVPRYPTSNHDGGALNITLSRPNSDLGEVRIGMRSGAGVDYLNNTTDKFFVSYMIL